MRAITKRAYGYDKGKVFAYSCEAGPGQCQQEAYLFGTKDGCNVWVCKEDNSLSLCCLTNPTYPQKGPLCVEGWWVCP